jgi:hypothetical protein
MANGLNPEVLDELERLENSATPGPWVWDKRDVDDTVLLVHPKRGWLTVMDFVRHGMQRGMARFAKWKEPERGGMGGVMVKASDIDLTTHPDARIITTLRNYARDLIEAARERDRLRNEVMRLKAIISPESAG